MTHTVKSQPETTTRWRLQPAGHGTEVSAQRPVVLPVGTTRAHRIPLWAGLTALLVALTLSLIFLASAHAATYCVQAPGCSGTNATLDQALSYAATSTDNDTVQIGPGTFSGNGFKYGPGANGGELTIAPAPSGRSSPASASMGTCSR